MKFEKKRKVKSISRRWGSLSGNLIRTIRIFFVLNGNKTLLSHLNKTSSCYKNRWYSISFSHHIEWEEKKGRNHSSATNRFVLPFSSSNSIKNQHLIFVGVQRRRRIRLSCCRSQFSRFFSPRSISTNLADTVQSIKLIKWNSSVFLFNQERKSNRINCELAKQGISNKPSIVFIRSRTSLERMFSARISCCCRCCSCSRNDLAESWPNERKT